MNYISHEEVDFTAQFTSYEAVSAFLQYLS